MSEGVRYGLLLRTCLEVLREAGRPIDRNELREEVARRVDLNDEEQQLNQGGGAKWSVALGYASGDAATIGWLVKQENRWWITQSGIAALDTYNSPVALLSECHRRYRDVFRSRKQARSKYAGVLDSLATAIELVPAGSWTSYLDLAEVVNGDPDEIAHLLADAALANSYRVLTAEGSIPPMQFVHFKYRGADLRERLALEGIEFDGEHARQDQRITADVLVERMAVADEPEPAGRRAWLVRGSNVDGVDLVPDWLEGGWVSLAASQLPAFATGMDDQELREMVAESYRHKGYSIREKLTEEFSVFLRRIRVDDYLITVHRGTVYLALVTGQPVFADVTDRRSALRRAVRWLNVSEPLDLDELPAPLAALVKSQEDVVDITDAIDVLDRLYSPYLAVAPLAGPATKARLGDVTDKLVVDLLMEGRTWLDDVARLLAERRQLVFYGPPGTGKTFVARKLAAALTEPHAVQLVQFHPSYTYEDFFEGFRPKSTMDGRLEFELRPGAFRRLADEAREHPSTAYILIIDEVNRGNLAKIFGELYFLLEYRDERMRLQYSQEDFTLPENLYLIGTMNTADRSIAHVDAAMRRRFAFVEMHPEKAPVAGLLARWLDREGIDSDSADLLTALNERLRDADYAIGPSYLMRESAYATADGLDRIWRYDILPLLIEHHYADEVDVEATYGLVALRKALATP